MIPYDVVLSRRYKTAYKRLSRHKDFDNNTLERVINTIARKEQLAPKYRNHQLSGELKDFRECHIKNDMLLVYQCHDDLLILLLVDIGNHGSLFR